MRIEILWKMDIPNEWQIWVYFIDLFAKGWHFPYISLLNWCFLMGLFGLGICRKKIKFHTKKYYLIYSLTIYFLKSGKYQFWRLFIILSGHGTCSFSIFIRNLFFFTFRPGTQDPTLRRWSMPWKLQSVPAPPQHRTSASPTTPSSGIYVLIVLGSPT